ncbi:hypothetical protein TNCV_178541 [Trichonephila clavipes]|nr:hypothetical protein TNCV_178541 [Trichonephila clavipes]
MKAIHRTRIVECFVLEEEKKPVSAEAIEKVALQVEEDKSSNVLASTSVRRVAETLDLPRSTVQKIMRNTSSVTIHANFNLCRNCFHMISRLDICSHCSFLLVWKLIQNGLWNILWTDEAHFDLDGSVNTTTAEFGKQTIRIPPYEFRYTHQK